MLHTMLIAGAFLLAIAAGTLGFAYEEWIIRPEDGRYIISSRSEEEIVGQAESVALWATIGAGAAGVVLLVRGLVA